jgi:hypothetical protein
VHKETLWFCCTEQSFKAIYENILSLSWKLKENKPNTLLCKKNAKYFNIMASETYRNNANKVCMNRRP